MISPRHALVLRSLTWLGLLGSDHSRIFAAPDLRAAWAVLTSAGSFLTAVALTLLLHRHLVMLFILLLILLIVAGLLTPGPARPLTAALAVPLVVSVLIPGLSFVPLFLVSSVVGVFVCLRYLSRHAAALQLDGQLRALASVFGENWKAYLPKDVQAQSQVRVLVSPDEETFFLGVVRGKAELKYGAPHVVWTGLTAEVLGEMAQRDRGVVQQGQTVLWVVQPLGDQGEYNMTLEHGVSTVIGHPGDLAGQLTNWSVMKANLEGPTPTVSEQGRKVEVQAIDDLRSVLPAGWAMRSSVLLAKGGDADIELTTHQQAKYVVDVKSRNDRMDLKAPKGDRAKSWTEIHEQVVGAARQLQGVPVVWQPLARDEDFSLVGEAWCLRGPAQTLIEALGALGSAEPDEGASPYQVLGLKPGATREEIQSAYKVLAKQYHPDRVASLGEEFRLLAERRMKVINAAYQALIGK